MKRQQSEQQQQQLLYAVYRLCDEVPCAAERAEALGSTARASASEITLAMTGEGGAVSAALGGEETAGGRERRQLVTDPRAVLQSNQTSSGYHPAVVMHHSANNTVTYYHLWPDRVRDRLLHLSSDVYQPQQEAATRGTHAPTEHTCSDLFVEDMQETLEVTEVFDLCQQVETLPQLPFLPAGVTPGNLRAVGGVRSVMVVEW